LKPLQESISSISHITDTAGRGSPFYNQLMTVSDSIMVLAWPTIEPKPYKHIESTLESAQFWGNKILKEYKEK
jgi:adenylyl cyclase-associated protein